MVYFWGVKTTVHLFNFSFSTIQNSCYADKSELSEYEYVGLYPQGVIFGLTIKLRIYGVYSSFYVVLLYLQIMLDNLLILLKIKLLSSKNSRCATCKEKLKHALDATYQL